jgi:hypothetical protein
LWEEERGGRKEEKDREWKIKNPVWGRKTEKPCLATTNQECDWASQPMDRPSGGKRVLITNPALRREKGGQMAA